MNRPDKTGSPVLPSRHRLWRKSHNAAAETLVRRGNLPATIHVYRDPNMYLVPYRVA